MPVVDITARRNVSMRSGCRLRLPMSFRDVVSAIAERHGVFQVDAVIGDNFVDAVALAVSPCDDVSKEGIPAHRFAVFQYTRKYFVIIIRLEVAHDLQNFLASCIFDGLYGRYVDFYQVCYFLYSLVHPCDEPCIVVDEYEREFRMLFIEQRSMSSSGMLPL